MSFKKFNPAIEKLFKELTAEKELAECEAREKEDTVSDEQMAERLSIFESKLSSIDLAVVLKPFSLLDMIH